MTTELLLTKEDFRLWEIRLEGNSFHYYTTEEPTEYPCCIVWDVEPDFYSTDKSDYIHYTFVYPSMFEKK
ncbi:MAG: hypothetical protein IJ504_01210 [Bacteroidales bacterium]|nr:hypothetical protein [Bacteroidales bacterium]